MQKKKGERGEHTPSKESYPSVAIAKVFALPSLHKCTPCSQESKIAAEKCSAPCCCKVFIVCVRLQGTQLTHARPSTHEPDPGHR